ncbi:MAG TPA: UbiA family prenyltransferase [Steroidobacteraceae bacterium]|nr:UbiA family prenyltransferase [Steroidobacteraceae bacterium]
MVANARRLVPPLCVDLDGTLIQTDLLAESLLILLKRNPFYLLLAFYWLIRGRAVLKAEVAARAIPNAAVLPYNREFLAWLRSERRDGRELWLCTAANEKQAAAVASHLGIFDGVIASDARTNLAGRRKADQLVQHFGERGFDYCGNERRDLETWSHARGAIVVSASAALERDAKGRTALFRTFAGPREHLAAVWRALRPHQWSKNVLVFVPLLAAHRATDMLVWLAGLRGFVAFCLCASAVYVVNDLLDLEADRAHPRKCRRPFAAGELSIAAGLLLMLGLLGAGVAVAVTLPVRFALALGAYLVLTGGYSLVLKRFLLIDAVALAGLYTLRIIAGASAAGIALSFWLLLFAVFLFLSLAFVKRYAELEALRRQQRLQALGRGYRVEDLAVLQSFGTAAGYLSVLVLALYINSPDIQALYRHPKVIWMLCVLMLYWISRVWMTAHRGGMHDDPVVYALRDRVSLGVGVLAAVSVFLAI